MDYLGRYTTLPVYLTGKTRGSGIGVKSAGSDEDCSTDGYVCLRDGGCSSHTICGSDGCSSDSTCQNDHMCSFDGGCNTDVCSQNVQPVQPPSSSGYISSHSSTNNSITIYYNSIPGATSYEVMWRVPSSYELLGSAIVYGNSYPISGLSPDTEYIINYRGKNDGGVGPTMPNGYHAWTTSDSNAFIHDGSAFRRATVYVHDGSRWVKSTPEVHNGSRFVP